MLVSSISSGLMKNTVAFPRPPRPVVDYQKGLQRFENSNFELNCCTERKLNSNGLQKEFFA